MPEFEIPAGNEYIDQEMDYESWLSFLEEVLITKVDENLWGSNQFTEMEAANEGLRLGAPKNKSQNSGLVTDFTKLEDKRAMPGQTITLPKGAATNYSDDGKILESFSYTYEYKGKNISRTFVGVFDETQKKMLYSSYDDQGRKEMDYYSTWFFSNETEAYKFMWQTTQSPPGWINTERIAYIVEGGVYVSSNAFSGGNFSIQTIKTETREDGIYVNGKRVLAQMHTHPALANVGQGGFSNADKHNALGLKNAYQIIIEFNNNLSIGSSSKAGEFINYQNPQGLTRDALINGSFKLIPFLKSHPIK